MTVPLKAFIPPTTFKSVPINLSLFNILKSFFEYVVILECSYSKSKGSYLKKMIYLHMKVS